MHSQILAGYGGTGTVVTPYRYWRIYITANNGDSFTSFNELELRIGGSDQTSPGPYSGFGPSASSDYFGWNGEAAFDENVSDTSAWVASSGSFPQWVKYDFGAANEKAIEGFAIWPESTASFSRSPAAFLLQGSHDDSTWDTLQSYAAVSGWSAWGAGGGGYRVFST